MKRIASFYVQQSEFSDLDYGMAVFKDGTEKYVIDVPKIGPDRPELTPLKYRWYVRKLQDLMPGLKKSEQVMFLNDGLYTFLTECSEEENMGVYTEYDTEVSA